MRHERYGDVVTVDDGRRGVILGYLEPNNAQLIWFGQYDDRGELVLEVTPEAAIA
jgi:ethanolamine utilization protein EutQ (cupin superfamily)